MNVRLKLLYVALIFSTSILSNAASAQIGEDCEFSGPFFCSRNIASVVTDGLGRKVSIDNGIVVSGRSQKDHNKVELFDFNSGESLLEIQSAEWVSAEIRFGYAVALNNSRLAVGCPKFPLLNGMDLGLGRVFVYHLDASTSIVNEIIIEDPTPFGSTSPHPEFGHDVDLNGDYVLAGEPFQQFPNNGPIGGMAHIYSSSDGSLIQSYKNPAAEDEDAFGAYVAVEQIGGEVLVAISAHQANHLAPDGGAVYLYDSLSLSATDDIVKAIETFPRLADKPFIEPLVPNGNISGIKFGQDTDLDNGRLLVTFTGGGILYDLTHPDFPVIQTFDHDMNDVNPYIIFPTQTCSLSGDTVVIGTPEFYLSDDDENGFDEGGSIHMYDTDTGVEFQTIFDPTKRETILELPINANTIPESWPNSVAICGNDVAAGSFYAGLAYRGELSLFRRDPLFGDCNFDGLVNESDKTPFGNVLRFGDYLLEADIDLNGEVDLQDRELFFDLIN